MMNKERIIRRETKDFQNVLLDLANKFFSVQSKTNDLQVLKEKLDELDRTWKQYATNWNHNPKHLIKLRTEDFLNFINDKLNETN